MNNTFDLKRFKQVLSCDWRLYLHNFGITLLVWIGMPVMFWVTSLVFGYEIDTLSRLFFLLGIVAITVMSAPSRIYGKANLPRDGVRFAMLPASALEKFVSMALYCSFLTPVLAFFGGWLIDSLMALLPFGGFIDFVSFRSPRMVSADYALMAVAFISLVWTESAVFMFGNMFFWRRKAGKTFGWTLLVLFALTLLLEFTDAWVVIDNFFADLNDTQSLWIIIIVQWIIAAGFYFATYRKIKTQKY